MCRLPYPVLVGVSRKSMFGMLLGREVDDRMVASVTAAVIAYKQPINRLDIERIRGVDSGHVVRGLLHRRLIHEQGRAETPGRPILYGTSMEFMERFGLTSLDDLPPLEAEIAAQLAQAEEDARSESRGEDDDMIDDEPPDSGDAGPRRQHS